jgi:hypothetical protein
MVMKTEPEGLPNNNYVFVVKQPVREHMHACTLPGPPGAPSGSQMAQKATKSYKKAARCFPIARWTAKLTGKHKGRFDFNATTLLTTTWTQRVPKAAQK